MSEIKLDGQPIILKSYKGAQVSHSSLGGGFEAEVQRRVFSTPDGERAYAYKPLESVAEATRILKIYKMFKEAGLPVVGFMKSIHERHWSDEPVGVAMEDATEGDKYRLLEVYCEEDYNIYPLLNRAHNAFLLRARMVEALAAIHNLGIYDYHPLFHSFFLKIDNADSTKVDFTILDYSNFTEQSNPLRFGTKEPMSFAAECAEDLDELLNSLTPEKPEREQLATHYSAIVAAGNFQIFDYQ